MAVFGKIVPVLTLGSISKRWVVPGWRLGWIAKCGPDGVFEQNKATTLVLIHIYYLLCLIMHTFFFLVQAI